MELRITDKEQILDTSFGRWLIDRMRFSLVRNFNNYNFTNWDKWLNETTSVSRLFDKNYSVLDIILFASKHIVCDGVNGELHIHFNNNIFVPGFDRWKLTTCIRTINFGNLEVKGCPIFTDTFDEFAEDIDNYVSVFYMI